MDITKILSTIKGKVLDAANYELLANAYDLQQQNIIQLKENNTSIKESNSLLKEKLESYKKTMHEQNEKITQLEELTYLPKTVDSSSRVEEEEEVLIFLSNHTKLDINKNHLSQHLNIKDEKTQYFLDNLQEDKLVCGSCSMSNPTSYSLTKQGRAYLVEQNLL